MNEKKAIRRALIAALKADVDVAALVGGRIYSNVPDTRVYPYLRFGPIQSVEDDAEGLRSFEVNVQIDAFSRAEGVVEVEDLLAAARAAIHKVDLTLAGDYRLIVGRVVSDRQFSQRDGETAQGILTYEADIQEGPCA